VALGVLRPRAWAEAAAVVWRLYVVGVAGMAVLLESSGVWGLGMVVGLMLFLLWLAGLTSGLCALALHLGLVGLLPSSTPASPQPHPALVLVPNPHAQLAIHQVHLLSPRKPSTHCD